MTIIITKGVTLTFPQFLVSILDIDWAVSEEKL
jgi:hypothetical protein